jgi:hypothetical protein
MKMCFNPGCPCETGLPGGVRVTTIVGTEGKIGGSRAEITTEFCSENCNAAFHLRYPTEEDVLKMILLFHRNRKKRIERSSRRLERKAKTGA